MTPSGRGGPKRVIKRDDISVNFEGHWAVKYRSASNTDGMFGNW